MQITLNLNTECLFPKDLRSIDALRRMILDLHPEWVASRKEVPVLQTGASATVGTAIVGVFDRGPEPESGPEAGSEAPAAPAPTPEAEPKARRGRPKKTAEAEAPAPETPAPTPAPVSGEPENPEFEALLKRMEAQMVEAGHDKDHIANAVKFRREKGPAGIEALKDIVKRNDKKIEEIVAARAKADQIRKDSEATATKPTAEEIRAAFRAYVDSQVTEADAEAGMKAGMELLKDFGCSYVSKVAEKSAEDIAEFMKLCAKGVAKGAANA